MELLKLLAALAFGGLAGQVLAEYFRRRGARLQTVTLIERVNREIAPGLAGITLARVLTVEGKRQLEEIKNVREYQLTLRNTSNLHLQNIEIQFEFPTADVQSWVSRPARSQTALIPTSANASEPWKSAFRWTIPHLPAADSVEFTFQAIATPSDKFVAALYNSDRVVIERVTREVRDPIRQKVLTGIPIVTLVFGLVAASFAAYSTGKFFSASSLSSDIEPFYQRVDGAGCHLIAKSQAFELSGVWHIYHELTNVGDKGCIVNWPNILDHKTVAPGQEEMASSLVDKRPSRAKSVLSFNADGQQPIQEEIDALPGRNK